MKKHITPTALKLMVELYVEAINKAKKNGVWRQHPIKPYNQSKQWFQHTGRGLSGPVGPQPISTKVAPPAGREIIFFDFKKEE